MRYAALFLALLLAGCSTAATVSRDWRSVASCWQRQGYDTSALLPPAVIVAPRCTPTLSGAGWFVDPFGREVYGFYATKTATVTVCPDLRALRHEYSHHASMLLRGIVGREREGLCGL